MKDYYSILGVSKNASAEEIRIAYINRSRILHPDRFDPQKQSKEWQLANEMMKELNEAYNVFKDPSSKSRYDASFNAADNTEGKYETPQQEYAKKENTQQTAKPSEAKTKKPGTTIFLKELPAQLQNLLKEMQNKRQGENFYGVRYKSIYSSYIISAGMLFGFYLVFNAAKSSLWATEGKVFVFLLSIIGTIFLFKNIEQIYIWHKATMGFNFFITPLYFIKTNLDEIRFWYIWDIEDTKATNNYKNGAYQNTTFQFKFTDAVETMVLKSMSEVQRFDQAFRELENARMRAASIRDWQWFEKLDIFSNVSGTTKSNPRKARNKQIYVTASLVALVFSYSVINYNEHYANDTFERYAKKQQEPTDDLNAPAPAPVPAPLPAPIFDKPAKPLPQNGHVYRYSREEPIAPLKIVVPSGGTHYFVKIVDAVTSSTVAAVFIRAGNSVRLEVPTGSYEIKYAMGTTWYGTKYLFGPETTAAKADKSFDFHIDGDKVRGYTVELIRQTGGNLQTSAISLKDF